MALPEFSERRVYRQRSWLRVFSFVFSGCALVFLIANWTEVIAGRKVSAFADFFDPLVFLAFGVFFIYVSFASYVALSPSAIESRSPFGHRKLPLGKIRGRRRYLDDGGAEMPRDWHLKVEPDDDRYPSLDFQESYYKFDAAFYDWFRSLPDLDELDKTRPKTSDFGLV